ncbi:MAG: tRNA (N6-threonylcarbamoyladenosine(37)-N6)-methyltransferase TrmO [Clostridiaceae bacterium]
MNDIFEIRPIAKIRTGFKTKFGIPRQSNLVHGVKGKIVFQPEFRNIDALKGLENYSYIWLIWGFSAIKENKWSPTVRPPRLGGNKRVGVFASRSPFRPNSLGLSSVKLEKIEIDPIDGPVLIVSGVDLMDETPIFDIKPYIKPDIHDTGLFGISDTIPERRLKVEFPNDLETIIPLDQLTDIKEVLSLDPSPSYQDDPERVYGMEFYGKEIRFKKTKEVIYVISVEDIN